MSWAIQMGVQLQWINALHFDVAQALVNVSSAHKLVIIMAFAATAATIHSIGAAAVAAAAVGAFG